MKNKLLIVTLLLMNISCRQNHDCEDKQLTIHHFDCANTKYSLKIDIQNDYTIIRSKETYDSKVTGDCHPTIDFSIYDLVIGRQSLGKENDTIIYDLRKTCPDNELDLNIDIIQSDATRPDNVVYHALIPKLGEEETIKIFVDVK
jgi:hypothetical protein